MGLIGEMLDVLLGQLITRRSECDVGIAVHALVGRHLGRVFGRDWGCFDRLVCNWGYGEFFSLHSWLLGDFVLGRLVGFLCGHFGSSGGSRLRGCFGDGWRRLGRCKHAGPSLLRGCHARLYDRL